MTYENTTNQNDKELEVRRPVAPEHLEAMGQLAAHEGHEEPSDSEAAVAVWTPIESGLQKNVPGVHLGVLIGPDGWNAGFKDSSETPVPEAGISFIVTQASYGYTGIRAKALPGFTVESGTLDKETGAIDWAKTPDHSDEVLVANDRGNLSDTPIEDWGSINLGNEGTQAGIVRVTDAENVARHFVLGANFAGEPDNWQVQGGIVEVRIDEPTALPAQAPKLESSMPEHGETPEEEAKDDNPYAELFRRRDEPEDTRTEAERIDAALRERKPQPPLTEADIDRLTQMRGKRPTQADIDGINGARASGIHFGF